MVEEIVVHQVNKELAGGAVDHIGSGHGDGAAIIGCIGAGFIDDGVVGGLLYAVFGEVIEGMDVVDAIAQVPTGQVRGYGDVPNEAVVIESVRRD